MKAHSIQVKSTDKLKQRIEDLITDGYQPTLAIVFTSLRDEWQNIQSLFNSYNIAIFGASSSWDFIDSDYQSESIAVLLLDMNPDFFQIEIEDATNDDIFSISSSIGSTSKALFVQPGFIISCANTELQSDLITRGLKDSCGDDISIIGGNSSTNRMSGGYVFSNGKKSDKGLLVLTIEEDKIEIVGEAISGWKPAGTAKTVTKCDGNWVIKLDGNPALGYLMKYIGVDIDFNDEDDLFNKIGNIYPLQVYNEDGTSYILPPLFFNEQEGSFMLAGPVEEGTKVKFSMPPDFDVVEAVVESAKEKRNKSLKEADAMIIFSCVGRLNCLGPLVTEEIQGLTEIWNVPSIGFFTFGEYGSVKNDKPRFHGTTVSWVVLKEK